MNSIIAAAFLLAAALPAWNFDTDGDIAGWEANAQITGIVVNGGVLAGRTTDWDPFFTLDGLDIPATPWQYVLFRVKSDTPCTGQLFWTGDISGAHGGLDESKSTRFPIAGSSEWQDIALVPGWHREGRITRMRLDLCGDMAFEIDHLRVIDFADALPPADTAEWPGGLDGWTALPGNAGQFSPPLLLPAEKACWVSMVIDAKQEGGAEFLWLAEGHLGLLSETAALRPGRRTYNILLAGHPGWKGTVAGIGVRLPDPENAQVLSLTLGGAPSGPADPDLVYFGFEDGLNRAGRECRLLALITNRGGGKLSVGDWRLSSCDGLSILAEPQENSRAPIANGEQAELFWTVRADNPGTFTATLAGPAEQPEHTVSLEFLPPVSVPKSDYVPVPVPVETSLDVCMYYFPGWDSDAKWDCIRRIAPVRKPLLGYYDESNPEIVDWQIKWALENGISCFLVDWYWSQGGQHLTHWFEAYRKAHYRDQLRVAIMWANHNAPGTHSREDWRAVTREWIDKYFTLPAYYHINGKPAVFIWDPSGVRRDLGGTEEVRAALEDSQRMAREAGHEGVEFVAMSGHENAAQAAVLLAEGYSGATTYHEWGRAADMAPAPPLARFGDVVDTAPAAWERRIKDCGPLYYHPVVDTGWDSRPWHGEKSLVLRDRDVAGFESLLNEAKAFCGRHDRKMLVLGPANEWGEGSYIEPNTEFGFGMYEAVRRFFGKGDPASWPQNFSPKDMGLGPYDFARTEPTLDWTFDEGPGGWATMMNATPAECVDGKLALTTLGHDPALVSPTPGLHGDRHRRMVVSMSVAAPDNRTGSAQLFWSSWGSATSEAASVRFDVVADGVLRDHILDLGAHPRWRGPISMLRFDPCDFKDAVVSIDRMRFEE